MSAPSTRITRRDAMDEEARALAENPKLQALLKEGRRSPTRTLEESNTRAKITPEEQAAARAYLDQLDREDPDAS